MVQPPHEGGRCLRWALCQLCPAETKKRANVALFFVLSWLLPDTKPLSQLAHLALEVILDADLVDQVDLRFQEVDVLFGIVKDALQQVP